MIKRERGSDTRWARRLIGARRLNRRIGGEVSARPALAGRQTTCTMQPGQHRRIPPLGRHAGAGLHRDQGGRHHIAGMSETDQLPMLLWALLASGQIQMRKVDGWETLAQPLERMPLDLAA